MNMLVSTELKEKSYGHAPALLNSLRRKQYFSSQIPTSSIFCFMFLFAGFRDNRNLEAKDSLTDSGCLHDRAQAMVMDPAAPTRKSTIISVYGPVLQCCRIGECAGGGRWHAAVGTVGGNCFPGICQPRVTLAISWSRNALHLLSVDLATLYTWYWWSLQRFTLAIS